MNIFIRATSFLVVLALSFPALSAGKSFVQLDADAMASTKAVLKSGKAGASVKRAYDSLMVAANKSLRRPLESVTEKTLTPPSKDKRDYLSISRYWWPDESKPDGMPWIRKDGQTNPATQSDQVDRGRLGRMVMAVRSLSLAYYFTGEERYAKKAAAFLETWYNNEKTMMNPNLEYAQRVPGSNKGRRAGILDGRLMAVHILDAVKILETSKSWSKENQELFQDWMTEYLDWLTKSRLGRHASENTNNHGSWYLYHAAAVAWYVGETDTVKKMAKAARRLIRSQINKEGQQTKELKRTRAFFYSAFNLEALIRLASVGQKVGVDLWKYESDDGASLVKALDYMAVYAKGNVKWPHPTQGQEIARLTNLFVHANNALGYNHYKEALSIDPYKKTKYGKVIDYLEVEEQERYLLMTEKALKK